MKNFLYTALIILVAYIAHLFLPWWVLPLVAGILAFALQIKPLHAFLFAFLGGALLWGITAFWIDMQNDGRLSARMGALLGGLSGDAMIVATAFLGALFAAMGGWSGSLGWHYLKGE